MQVKLNVCHVKYGDFVVWTESEIATERILPHNDFFENAADMVEHFFIYAVLPETVGKWYTRKHVADKDGIVRTPIAMDDTAMEEEDPEKSWCYCGEPSYGEMIMCEHEGCSIQWFHFDCLRIRCPPKTKWYCPSCRNLPKSTTKSNKRKHSDTHS